MGGSGITGRIESEKERPDGEGKDGEFTFLRVFLSRRENQYKGVGRVSGSTLSRFVDLRARSDAKPLRRRAGRRF